MTKYPSPRVDHQLACSVSVYRLARCKAVQLLRMLSGHCDELQQLEDWSTLSYLKYPL